VDDIIEDPPVRMCDRLERTVGRIAERDEDRALPIPRSVAASMIDIVTCPTSYWRVSRSSRSSESGTTRAIVAADAATWAEYRHAVASSRSRSRSVTTTKSHACWLIEEGVRRAASRIRPRSSSGIARS
jgi:hypothetical protein